MTLLDPQTVEVLQYFAKVDSPTGLAMFFYMSYRFKRLEDNISKLNSKLEALVTRVVKVEQDVASWIYE